MKAWLTLINYMLAAPNTKEACSKQKDDKHNAVPQFKVGDFIMIKTFDKNQTGMQNRYPIFE